MGKMMSRLDLCSKKINLVPLPRIHSGGRAVRKVDKETNLENISGNWLRKGKGPS